MFKAVSTSKKLQTDQTCCLNVCVLTRSHISKVKLALLVLEQCSWKGYQAMNLPSKVSLSMHSGCKVKKRTLK